MEGVAAGLMLQQDVGVQEVLQERLVLLNRDVGQRGGRVGVDVAPRVQTEESEHALLGGIQLLVGQGERGRDSPLGGGQLGQSAALITESVGQVFDVPLRPVMQAGGGDSYGQWQE